MKIDPEDQRKSLPRRWGLPLGIAASVAALSAGTVAVIGGHQAAKPAPATQPLGAGTLTSGPVSPSPTGTRASATGGVGPLPVAPTSTAARGTFTITSTSTTPIDAGTVGRILASCLGSSASRYHAVIAVRTPIASHDWDGVVVAVDSAGQYVQCETKGDKGTSQDVPPTFINNRLWSPGRLIEFFDSFGAPASGGQQLLLGAGHYTSGIAKITVSYGKDPKQYPAIMAGGAFLYAAAVSVDTPASRPFPQTAAPAIHAFDASGKEIYHQ